MSSLFLPPWLLVILVHLLIASLIWLFYGRDARGKGIIIPSEELLNDIKPYEAGALMAQGPNYASFVSLLIDVAERGAITFQRYEGGGYLSLTIERVQSKTHLLDSLEAAVLKRIFAYPFPGDSKEEAGVAHFGKYSEQTRLAYRLFEKKMYKHLVTRGWYAKNILTTQAIGLCIVVIWTSALYTILQRYIHDPTLSFMHAQILLLLPFLYIMPRLTASGAHAREQIRGLAWHIRVAEKDRLTFHESPQALKLKPGKLLAYAVALKIQKDWQSHFLTGYGKTPTH